MFVIQSDIPIPDRKHRTKLPNFPLELPWHQMVPGDSFFVNSEDYDILRLMNKVTGSANGALGAGKVTARTVIENGILGVRAWRIEW